jgi:hypothetical protein
MKRLAFGLLLTMGVRSIVGSLLSGPLVTTGPGGTL